ncbi:hypothetical protein AYW79_09155 [Ferroacidibacillus organovorans]|uniref:HAD family hydrolase n=1 Tax=Ferroacidibacillus organovorans TaxID=1765683 RepID=A0A853KBK3_9BACL|nr:Cof-type HAD-IIB family hydrolase [Ferroacidibacillus organovorans]OAG93734.1 hypothetical protein AYW79_09155 [Ferroacidibacillus organovorans]
MIRLIVSDVDGTLWIDDAIRENDVAALRQAHQQGIEIGLASGRMDPELQEVAKRLDIPCHRVSQNGSFVYDHNERLLASASFDLTLARQLLSFAANGSLPYTVSCTDNQIYIPPLKSTQALRDRMFMPVRECAEMERLFEQGTLPCKFGFFGDLDTLHKLRTHLLERFPNALHAVIADRDCLDVIPGHVSKGVGLRSLIEHRNIQSEEMVCIGDSFNDLAMFEVTPHSFAMSHSDPAVLKAARHVTASVADVCAFVNHYNRDCTAEFAHKERNA